MVTPRMFINLEEVYMLEDPRLQMEERNIQHAIIGDVMTRLPEILQSLTKSRLSSLATVNQISGRSKMKKEELADALSAYLTDPEQLKSIVLVTDADEWALLETFIKEPSIQNNELPFGQYSYFLERGLVFSFFSEGKLYVLMPEEIKAAASQINLSELNKEHGSKQEAYEYIAAAAHLYGVIKLDKLVHIFNSQNSEAVTEEELSKYAGEMIERGQNVLLHDGVLFNGFVANGADADKLAELAQDLDSKPFYIPEKEELLRYADLSYFEMTPQLAELKGFVLNNMTKDQELVEYLIDDIQLACMNKSSMQELINQFENRKISFKTPVHAQRVISLLAEVYNSTRMWANGGHTLVEMSAMKEGEDQGKGLVRLVDDSENVVTKVGRNEPCPCGSGLKYKKCHGK
ncbi:SEC-C domain-containing protein [Paenibacillus sp. KQZ6P-2]|uniref:SEC-C domain-containing protein n=1 Tax=Paenibacillus mangrovi TaxID=2931978 RepID=A0A9X2B550_9BACL|nr:SEC-C metal-binding domain-containing protein [Paenibacillus mangrovi]MCJ8014670.1 SEC-C domain-containing protein [Paenibacillus mangrovi]